MMKVVTVISLSVVLTACVVSIEPTIPASESVYEAGLLGTWVESGEKDTAVVMRDGDGGYVIDYTDQDGTGRFGGRVGRVGGRSFLEVRPVLPDGASEAYEALLLPGHLLFAMTLDGDDMRLVPLDIDAVREALRHEELAAPHLSYSENSLEGREQVILTGSSVDLRTWLARVAERAEMWGETGVWRRIAPK